VNATVSTIVQPGLYALEVSVVVDGKNGTYAQPRSVWVMSHYPSEFRIAQLTDVHYEIKPEHLRQAIAQLNFLRPTVAMITGDIADMGSSEREVRGFWAALQDADFPTYCLPGNHDYQGGGESNYVKYEGPLNYSVDMGFAYFIALDTGYERNYVSVNQIEWAGRMLATVPASEFKIVAFHHPFFADTILSTAMNISGSWESIQDLAPLLYYPWTVTEEALGAARELLRMVQEHNVSLILQGHIHRDEVFILNQKHYFVVTTSLGGPPVPGMPYGYRVVTVDNGRITGLTYLNRPLSTFATAYESHSIPVGLFKVGYGPENDGSSAVVTAVLQNNRGDVVDGTLEIALSKEYPVEQYRTFPEAVPYSVAVGPSAYYFRFNLTLSPGEGLRLTVATAPDSTPPTIGAPKAKIIPIASKYSVKLQPEITDTGWGVENATLLYLLEGTTDWKALAMTPGPDNTFEATISGILNNETASYKIVAYDYAGHKTESETQTVSSQQTTASATTTSLITTQSTPVKTSTRTQTSSATPSTSAATQTSTESTTTMPSTTVQTTSAASAATVTTSSAPSTTEAPPTTTILPIVAAIVLVVAVVAAALLIRRRSARPGKPWQSSEKSLTD